MVAGDDDDAILSMVEPVSMLGPGNGINWECELATAAADDDDDNADVDDATKWWESSSSRDAVTLVCVSGFITSWHPESFTAVLNVLYISNSSLKPFDELLTHLATRHSCRQTYILPGILSFFFLFFAL